MKRTRIRRNASDSVESTLLKAVRLAAREYDDADEMLSELQSTLEYLVYRVTELGEDYG